MCILPPLRQKPIFRNYLERKTREAPDAMESLLFSYYLTDYQGIYNGLTILQFPILSAPVSGRYSLHKDIRHSLQKWLSLFPDMPECMAACN